MKNPVRSTMHAILISSLAGLGSAQVVADADVEVNPEVEAKIETLGDALKDRKAERDPEAVRLIGELLETYRKPTNPRDRRDIERAVASVFTARPQREPDQLALYEAAAKALGEMGRQGARVLQPLCDRNRPFPKKPEWVPLRVTLFENLGKTKEGGPILKFLIDEATRNPEKALMAAAGGALGNYADVDQKERKEIVNKLLIRWGELDARWRQGNTDPNDFGSQEAGDFLTAIKDKWNTTISALTGQKIGKFFDWQQWWNDNKNANWDKSDG